MDVQTWNFTVKRESDDNQSTDCMLQTQIKQENSDVDTSSDESDSMPQVCEENVVFIKQEEKQLEFVPLISTTCQNDSSISGNSTSTAMSDTSVADTCTMKREPLPENSGSNNTVQIQTYPFMVTRFDQQNSGSCSVDSNFDVRPVRSHRLPKSHRKSDSFTSVNTSSTVTLNCKHKTVSSNYIPLSSPKLCKSRLTPNLLTSGVFPFAKHKVVSCQTTNFTSREFPKDSKWGSTVHQAANGISIKPASSSENQMFIRIEPLSKDDVQCNENAINSQSVPTFNRQDVPTATQLSVPVANRQNVPKATQLSVPVSNRQNVPTATQLSVPVAKRRNVSTATQLGVPAANRQNVPTATQLSVPVSNRQNVPTIQLSVPVPNRQNVPTTQLSVSVAKRRNVPTATQMSVTAANRHNIRSATQLNEPEANRQNVPTATQLNVPAANKHNVPTTLLSVPVANGTNVPTATQLNVPAAKRQNVPTATQLSVLAANRHNVPTTLLSVPVANGTNVPTATQLNVLVAKRRFLPKTITLNVPKRERQKLSKLVFLRQTSNEQNVPTSFGQNVLTAVGQNVPVSIGQNVPTAIKLNVPTSIEQNVPTAIGPNVPISNIDLTFDLISRRLSEDQTTSGGGRKRKHPSEADFTQISVNQKHENKSSKLTKERQLSIEVVDNIICFESLSEDESNNCGSTSVHNAEPINDLLQDLDQNGQNDFKSDSK